MLAKIGPGREVNNPYIVILGNRVWQLNKSATRVGPLGPEHGWQCVYPEYRGSNVLEGHYSPIFIESILKLQRAMNSSAITRTHPFNCKMSLQKPYQYAILGVSPDILA